jgi:hypothetical protein
MVTSSSETASGTYRLGPFLPQTEHSVHLELAKTIVHREKLRIRWTSGLYMARTMRFHWAFMSQLVRRAETLGLWGSCRLDPPLGEALR